VIILEEREKGLKIRGHLVVPGETGLLAVLGKRSNRVFMFQN
jgi:uncharacterized membrane protein (UPF0127 family)